MTTPDPTPPVIQPTGNMPWTWDADMTNLNNAMDKHNKDDGSYQTDQTDYQARMDLFDKFALHHSPEETLLYFFAYIQANSDSEKHDNISGLYDDQIGLVGDSMTGNARSTALTNDLQNLINNKIDPGSVPVTGGSGVDGQVDTAYWKIYTLQQTFGSQEAQDTFGSDTCSQIVQQLNKMSDTLVTYFNSYNMGKTGQGPLGSFQEMEVQMSMKGDPTKADDKPTAAVAAYKAFSEALQTLTSVTQNFSAQMNQRISQKMGELKTWTSFTTAVMKDKVDESNALIQNQCK